MDEYNAGDESSVKDKQSRAARKESSRLNGLKQIMESKDGRAWLWGFLADCSIFSSCFTGNSQTFFNEGKRDAGLKVLKEVMKHHPDQYILMAKEGESNV